MCAAASCNSKTLGKPPSSLCALAGSFTLSCFLVFSTFEQEKCWALFCCKIVGVGEKSVLQKDGCNFVVIQVIVYDLQTGESEQKQARKNGKRKGLVEKTEGGKEGKTPSRK